MQSIFLLYMPPGNLEAMAHYRDTIRNRVELRRMAPFLSRDFVVRLRAVFGDKPIAVWGSRDGPGNRSRFERMQEGDDLLIVEGESIKLIGKVALKVVSPDLSRELWSEFNGANTDGWSLIYFIANAREVAVPFASFRLLFGYGENYQLRGFTAVAPDRLEAFYDRFEDLYSVLQRIQQGLPILPRGSQPISREGELVELEREDVEQVLQSEIVTDHVRMQWKLLNLGLKTGAKVWVPTADQAKLRRIYEYDEFESRFASGIDLPHSYVENIDVVWKDEFRVDAAFEVENSTAIYSGLLRFADLNILAPNTTYPMFIVAPTARRNQVREQLRRPAFARLGIREKVRFLSYEVVDEIDQFFNRSSGGLTADLVAHRSEVLD